MKANVAFLVGGENGDIGGKPLRAEVENQILNACEASSTQSNPGYIGGKRLTASLNQASSLVCELVSFF